LRRRRSKVQASEVEVGPSVSRVRSSSRISASPSGEPSSRRAAISIETMSGRSGSGSARRRRTSAKAASSTGRIACR
jgi:hypothetical protein